MARIKEGFKGERMLSLPQDILHKYSQHPLVKPLFIRKLPEGQIPLCAKGSRGRLLSSVVLCSRERMV